MPMKEDVLDTVRRLGHGLVDSAQNRLRLLQTELADELDRLGVLLARQILVALLALLTVQSLALVLLAMVWDTRWRVASVLALAVLAATGTALSYRWYLADKRRKHPVFATSVDELEKDRQALERAL